MLSSPLSDSLNKGNSNSSDACTSEGSCGGGQDHNHARVSIGIAVIGGILILNSFLAQQLFYKNDPIASTLSALIGSLLLSLPIFYAAFKDMLKGRFYMNELVALALLAAFVIGNFQEVGIIAFFMLLAISIEEKTAIGAKKAIEALIKLTPVKTRKIDSENGEEVLISAQKIRVNDLIRVRPGENFSADGILVKGVSTVNQASITGESLSVDVEVGSQVFAGTENLTGLVEVRVSAIGADSTLGKVRSLIEDAEKSRLPILRMADDYVGYYTPVILMIAAVVWFFTQDLLRVVLILVIACPCALIVATPSAVIAAIAAAARMGILIKNVAHIETAAKIDSIVFDKTGTLTTGKLEVGRLCPADGIELTELLSVAAMAEAESNHPAAEALKKLAEEAKVQWKRPDKFTEYAGKGVIAEFGCDLLHVGKEVWFNEVGIKISEIFMKAEPDQDPSGMSIVHVAKNKKCLGWIGLRDTIRPKAKQALDSLHNLGIMECCMVTGDNDSVAKLVADQVGIRHVESNCMPETKVETVKKLKESSSLVAVVGDGINDAPALAEGDIGIAMGAIGSDIAVNSASIALMNNDLLKIPALIKLSRKTRSTIWMNIVFGSSIIVGGLIFFTTGNQFLISTANFFNLNPSVTQTFLAAAIHVGGTLAVFFNSARLIRFDDTENN